jgi:hypothetical protein
MLGEEWAPELDDYGAGKDWTTCKYAVSRAGDICKKNSWVFYMHPVGNFKPLIQVVCSRRSQSSRAILAGQIRTILIPILNSTQENQAAVIIRPFNVSATRHARLNMPDLSPSIDSNVITQTMVHFALHSLSQLLTLLKGYSVFFQCPT